jgi:hypothetical protein
MIPVNIFGILVPIQLYLKLSIFLWCQNFFGAASNFWNSFGLKSKFHYGDEVLLLMWCVNIFLYQRLCSKISSDYAIYFVV